MLASELVGQGTQKIAGQSEIHDGIKEMEDYWEHQREKVRLEWAARQPKPKPRVARKVRTKKLVPTLAAKSAPKPVETVVGPMTTAEAMRRRSRELKGEM